MLVQDCIMSCLLCELTVPTRSDNGSHNRLNLIQSIVPTHICNGYVPVNVRKITQNLRNVPPKSQYGFYTKLKTDFSQTPRQDRFHPKPILSSWNVSQDIVYLLNISNKFIKSKYWNKFIPWRERI